MSNVKEQIIKTKLKRAKNSCSQEFAISEQGEKQHAPKLILENQMKDKLLFHKPNDDFPESTNNHIVYMSESLVAYGRETVMRDWDPNTPRVTEEEREILRSISHRGALKNKRHSSRFC